MSLSSKQQRFADKIGQLIHFIYNQGWAVTFGDAYRDPRTNGDFGTKKGYAAGKSVHKLRLAIDLNLFVDGNYITGDSPEYQVIGEQWKSMDEDARWGGEWQDFNHFSFEQWGKK
jgi:hypothetical protein